MIKAEYIDHMGDDLRVVNAARVSFDKESEWQCCQGGNWKEECWKHDDVSLTGDCKILSDQDKKLIKYLATHNHWTPFSHCMITMRETVPIFVARQRFKHMVGFTYNEVSRRYVDDTPEFYIPDEWRKRAENKKQGSSDEIVLDYPYLNGRRTINDLYEDFLDHSIDIYNKIIELEIAPEQARMVLPQSMFTSYYVTGSLAAWSRAYKLRIDSHAQKEIQDLAKQWDEIIKPLFPVSWEELVGNS